MCSSVSPTTHLSLVSPAFTLPHLPTPSSVSSLCACRRWLVFAAVATAVREALNQQVVSGNISPWQVEMLCDLISHCRVIFSVSESLPKRTGQPVPAGTVTAIYPLLTILASVEKLPPLRGPKGLQTVPTC